MLHPRKRELSGAAAYDAATKCDFLSDSWVSSTVATAALTAGSTLLYAGESPRLQSRASRETEAILARTPPQRLFAPSALLPSGWMHDVAIDIDIDGAIASLTPQAVAGDAEVLRGPVLPAMPNAHSHAFQRALSGRTGAKALAHGDDFWSWRGAMYALVERVDPDAMEAIAAQAYVEMAKAGYAGVAEFHYLHNDADGRAYDDPSEMAWRIAAAANTAGVALTLLPVFYAHGNFGGAPLAGAQRRFANDVDSYARLVEALRGAKDRNGYVVGVAPHSLRAVAPEELRDVVQLAGGAPVHIHAAEQSREVEDCQRSLRARPVEWLLAHAGVDSHWCIVHATHMSAIETERLGSSSAVAGLAPTTEADLGDGTFAAEAFMRAGGRIAVGSDSNTIVDPFAELRQLEWSQRIALERRNVLVQPPGERIGTALWRAAASGGGQALGRRTGTIEVGARADLVVLDTDDAALAELAPAEALDAAIFGPCRRPVRDVIVNGRWIVRDAHHPQERPVLARYRATLARLASAA
jgi:formimidoylglutamate deiminase